jgi:hypothetical protein
LPFNCQKEKEKIVLATPLLEVSFSYPPFLHMGNTEIPPKKKKKKEKKRKMRNNNCFMHVHGHNPPTMAQTRANE